MRDERVVGRALSAWDWVHSSKYLGSGGEREKERQARGARRNAMMSTDLGGCWQVGVWGRGKWVLAGLLNDELKFRFSLPSYVNRSAWHLKAWGSSHDGKKDCLPSWAQPKQDRPNSADEKKAQRGTRGWNSLQFLGRTEKTMNGPATAIRRHFLHQKAEQRPWYLQISFPALPTFDVIFDMSRTPRLYPEAVV